MTTLEAAIRLFSAMEDRQRTLYKQQAAGRKLWREFGALVRESRIAKGVTLKLMAAGMGVTTRAMSRLESGRSQWTLETAKTALRLLVRHPLWPNCPPSRP